jgi:hypothetical protein
MEEEEIIEQDLRLKEFCKTIELILYERGVIGVKFEPRHNLICGAKRNKYHALCDYCWSHGIAPGEALVVGNGTNDRVLFDAGVEKNLHVLHVGLGDGYPALNRDCRKLGVVCAAGGPHKLEKILQRLFPMVPSLDFSGLNTAQEMEGYRLLRQRRSPREFQNSH